MQQLLDIVSSVRFVVTFQSDPGFVHERILLHKLTNSTGVVYTPGGDMYKEGTDGAPRSLFRDPNLQIHGTKAQVCIAQRIRTTEATGAAHTDNDQDSIPNTNACA